MMSLIKTFLVLWCASVILFGVFAGVVKAGRLDQSCPNTARIIYPSKYVCQATRWLFSKEK